jgi:serine/threonine-protein kinase RsbT
MLLGSEEGQPGGDSRRTGLIPAGGRLERRKRSTFLDRVAGNRDTDPDPPEPLVTRTARSARSVATEADLVAVAGPVRRVAAARTAGTSSPAEVDDVVQETLARLWESRWRLERGALLAYGVVTARNLVTSVERGAALRDRHAPRLLEPAAVVDPALDVLADEERTAVLAALAALREDDRRLLLEHEVRGVGTAKIAAEEGVSAGAVAARLARARARLRVGHLLALRRVELPTTRCRPVLDALSLGDRRRQLAVRAAEHLLTCATCADLAEPLLTRRRSLTALAPVALLLAPGRLWSWARANPAPASAGGIGVAAVAVAVAVAVSGSPAAPAPPPAAAPPAPPAAAPAVPATLSVGGARLLPAARVGSLRAHSGRTAVARDVPVQSVAADEGFWVGAGPGRRVWVQLRATGESAVRVRPGQSASFAAEVVPAPADFPARAGVSAAEGAAEIRAAGVYLLVDPERLTLR